MHRGDEEDDDQAVEEDYVDVDARESDAEEDGDGEDLEENMEA